MTRPPAWLFLAILAALAVCGAAAGAARLWEGMGG